MQVLIAKDLMVKTVSTWVHGDPDQLEPSAAEAEAARGDASSVKVQEYCVYFANQRPRAWPWLFMRKSAGAGGNRPSNESFGVSGAAGVGSGAAGVGSGAAGVGSGAAEVGSGAAGVGSGAAGVGSGAAGVGSGVAGVGSGAAGVGSGAAGVRGVRMTGAAALETGEGGRVGDEEGAGTGEAGGEEGMVVQGRAGGGGGGADEDPLVSSTKELAKAAAVTTAGPVAEGAERPLADKAVLEHEANLQAAAAHSSSATGNSNAMASPVLMSAASSSNAAAANTAVPVGASSGTHVLEGVSDAAVLSGASDGSSLKRDLGDNSFSEWMGDSSGVVVAGTSVAQKGAWEDGGEGGGDEWQRGNSRSSSKPLPCVLELSSVASVTDDGAAGGGVGGLGGNGRLERQDCGSPRFYDCEGDDLAAQQQQQQQRHGCQVVVPAATSTTAKRTPQVHFPDGRLYAGTSGPLNRCSGGAGSGAFSAAAAAAEGNVGMVDMRRGTTCVTPPERRYSWRSAVSQMHSGDLPDMQQHRVPSMTDRSNHSNQGDSRWLAGGIAQELLLWQLEQQVDLSGGLHTGKRHRRESLCSYGPAASQPGAPAIFDDDADFMFGAASVVGEDAERSGLLLMMPVTHEGMGGGGFAEGGAAEAWGSKITARDGSYALAAPAAVADGDAMGAGHHHHQQQQQQQAYTFLGVANGVHTPAGNIAAILPVTGAPSATAAAASVRSIPIIGGRGDRGGLPMAAAARSIPIQGGGDRGVLPVAAVPLAPDPEMLQSLRKAQSFGRGGAMSTHGTELSTAGFEGVSINQTCRAMMSSRWLWARQLLIHDLGTFK